MEKWIRSNVNGKPILHSIVSVAPCILLCSAGIECHFSTSIELLISLILHSFYFVSFQFLFYSFDVKRKHRIGNKRNTLINPPKSNIMPVSLAFVFVTILSHSVYFQFFGKNEKRNHKNPHIIFPLHASTEEQRMNFPKSTTDDDKRSRKRARLLFI